MKIERRYSCRYLTRVSTATGIAILVVASRSASHLYVAVAQNGDTQAVCNSDHVNIRDTKACRATSSGRSTAAMSWTSSAGPVDADGYTWRNVNVTGTNVNGWVAGMFLD